MKLCKTKGCGKPVPPEFKEFCSRECFGANMKAESAARRERYAHFEKLWAAAHEAGMAAGHAALPEPMVVTPDSMTLNGRPFLNKTYVVPDGVCGFAWVTVPGNSSFAKWRKKMGGRAEREYYGGCCIKWVAEFNQSMTRKEAYAEAMARVLNEGGVPARSHSRID
jgi:hypothetical protein